MTGEGFAQAQALAKHLRVHWQPIHLILSNDLRRAAESTDEISKEAQTPVLYTPEWREMNDGDLAGMTMRWPRSATQAFTFMPWRWMSRIRVERVLGGTSSELAGLL